jgi:hypothetical protein
MRNKKILKTSLLCILFVLMISLSNCKRQPMQTPVLSNHALADVVNLPDPIQQTHRGSIFKITWFEKPFSGYYDRLLLHTDGYVDHWRIVENRGMRGASLGQLTQEEKQEIQSILEKMIDGSSVERSVGLKVITLNFLWRGENHILSFSESSCPHGLQRLFDIADAAFRRNPKYSSRLPNPCQENTENQGQTQKATSQSDTLSSTTNLPDPVRQAHGARLFCVTWFEQPFTGSYDKLSLFADNLIGFWLFVDDGGREVARGWLTESERQEVQTVLESMTNARPLEKPAGKTVFTLSFSWNADYYLFTFGDLSCPDDLHRLFEIADVAFQRNSSENEDFQNPLER